ncbi:MAG: diguanylate cyclase [Gammaproteobacteria bacterium]|nr:diguanylate cyclase [Gammaproteobacteria bacterium]
MSRSDAETAIRPVPNLLEQAPGPNNAYLTVLQGTSVGRTYRLGPGRLIVGRAADCDVVIDDDGVSRRHGLLVVTMDGEVTVEDLGSTNGTLVDGQHCDVLTLHGGERLQFGSETIFKLEFRDQIEEQFATYLYESATQDHLTGVFNKQFLRNQLPVEFAWHTRHQHPLSLIFIDIDHFKQVNDEFGHLIGDAVLRDIATRCRDAARTEDVFVRYGGEEFVCLLRQTDVEKATVVAERMRCAVEEHVFEFDTGAKSGQVRVTISAGVAEIRENATDSHTLLTDADLRLYQAKRKGRNCVESAPGCRISCGN